MSGNIEIIPCNFNDPLHRTALVNLMNEYISDEMGAGIPYNDEQKAQLVEGLQHHPAKLIILAKVADRFIGLTNCFVNFATFTVKPFINIHDVIVTKEWRNQGVGKIMIEKVIEKAGELGCSKVTLEVREDNQNAQHLYNILGFHDAEPRQYYWTRYI